MKTSVIVPTYNGAHKILNILHALEVQTKQPDEVIVVIDGSTDGTADLIRSNSFGIHSLRIIERENGGRSKVRNRGAKEASGDLLIFFDDDMRPQPECVSVHVTHHLRHPESILTGVQQEEVSDKSGELLWFKSCLSKKWSAPLVQLGDEAMPADMAFITAANCSMSKTVWERLGGMDERLTDAEDYDMATRATKMGIPIYYSAKAVAWHDDFITCVSYIRRLRQYAAAQQKLQMLKPELYSNTHRFAILKPSGLKAVFFKMFCYRFWIQSIDKERWKFLPMAQRHRLYDWVVTANGSFYPERVPL